MNDQLDRVTLPSFDRGGDRLAQVASSGYGNAQLRSARLASARGVTGHVEDELAADLLDAPIGPLLAVVDQAGVLVKLEFLADASLAAAGARLTVDGHAPGELAGLRVGAGTVRRDPARLAVVASGLRAYFEGNSDVLDLPVAPRGTGFQRDVWAALRQIPRGATSTYAAIATQIGRPRAVRAAGQAIGANPVAIVIPCHRVVGADGSLTGFGGGLPTKRRLLTLEGVLAPDSERVVWSARASTVERTGQRDLFAATTDGAGR